MTKMSHIARPCRRLLLWATVTLAITGSALAQSAGAAKPAAAASDDSGYLERGTLPRISAGNGSSAFQGTT